MFAGCLLADAGGQGAKDLREKGSERLKALQMDVTSTDQLEEALKDVEKLLPDDGKSFGVMSPSSVDMR